ncbi:MAG: Rhomboid family protein [Flaviaesturariibacter sp.]|nr:Rhomboid family protein [Flaviaesturariibacter sp.]
MAPVTLLLILLNVFVSYRGFVRPWLVEKYAFQVDALLLQKDYKRLLTSGFFHTGWFHLILNMVSLYAFSELLEAYLGSMVFLLVYIWSLLGGNVLALFLRRADGGYSAIGASGAINGIIFASIVLYPGMGVGLLGLPLSIPGWLFGLLYMAFSMYGIRARSGSVGHEAHLGGALAGMLLAIILQPSSLVENTLVICAVCVPALFFTGYLLYRPEVLDRPLGTPRQRAKVYNIDHRYNQRRKQREEDMDRLLEKVHRHGMESLSKAERQRLDAYGRM